MKNYEYTENKSKVEFGYFWEILFRINPYRYKRMMEQI